MAPLTLGMNPFALEFKPSGSMDPVQNIEQMPGPPPGLALAPPPGLDETSIEFSFPPGLAAPGVSIPLSLPTSLGMSCPLSLLPPPGLDMDDLSDAQKAKQLEKEKAYLKNVQLELETASLAQANAGLRAFLQSKTMPITCSGPPGSWAATSVPILWGQEPWVSPIVDPWMQWHSFGMQSACSDGSTDEGMTEGSVSGSEDADGSGDDKDIYDSLEVAEKDHSLVDLTA